MTSEGFHESAQECTTEARDFHRAVASLIEKLEAIEWYPQRVDATHNEDLQAILAHNQDEEKGHASLEWIGRPDAIFDTSFANICSRQVPSDKYNYLRNTASGYFAVKYIKKVIRNVCSYPVIGGPPCFTFAGRTSSLSGRRIRRPVAQRTLPYTYSALTRLPPAGFHARQSA